MNFKKDYRAIIQNFYKKLFYSAPKNSYKSQIKSKWFGSSYGGFFVCQDILKNDHNIIVYSCGIGTDISFDKKILKKYNKSEIFAFDPTPISLEWIKKQKGLNNFYFFPVGISNFNGKETMYFPKYHGVSYGIHNWSDENKDEIKVDMRTINDLAIENSHHYIDILKMDIEGSEFSVIDSIDFNKLEFGQILIEFHERFLENGSELLKTSIDKLNEFGYECFAISDDYEYSFINKRKIV